jgi:hypothetical protein
MDNHIITLLALDTRVLALNLSTISNRNLFDSFRKNFIKIGEFVTTNNRDKLQLWQVAKVYIDEIQLRLQKGSLQDTKVFAKMLQNEMYLDRKGDATFYTNTLLRLYSRCVKIMRAKGIPPRDLRINYL